MAKYNVGDKVLIRATRGSCWNMDGEMDKYCNTVMTIRLTDRHGCDGLYYMEEDKDENCGHGWCWSDEDIVKKVDEDTNMATSDFKVKCIKVKKYPEYFTVGKIYEVKDNQVVCDNGFVGDAWAYPMNGNADFEAFSRWWSDWFDFELVEENNNIVEEDNNMFTKNDLKTGMFGVMSNGQGYFVVVDDKVVYKNGGYDTIHAMSDDMDLYHWRIEKVYTDCPSFDGLHGRINRGDTDGLVYDRERDTVKLYNGKIVCIDNCHNDTNYTIGKIYEFKDGQMTCDNGHIFGKNEPFHDFNDWANYSSAKFLEIVE